MGNELAQERSVKLIATRAFAWIALVGLYALSPIAGIAALSAGFGFAARGKSSPVQERA
jgi:hypothetical protein